MAIASGQVMSDYDTFGTRMGRYFGLGNVPCYTTQMGKAGVHVARLQSRNPRLGVTNGIPPEDSYFIGVPIRTPSTTVTRTPTTFAMWLDNAFIPRQPFDGDSVCFIYAEREVKVDVQTPWDMIHICIPRVTLGEIARDFGVRAIDALRCPPLVAIDSVITNLAKSLLPYLAGAGTISAPFVDHVLLALQVHVAQKYGQMTLPLRNGKESLAPWQIRRAKELMASRLSGSVSLAELAQECQLSVSHFARAFKGSVGIAPHRWLVEHKMEQAKQLLQSTSLTIAAIALECGFLHRVAFSNAFQRTVGVGPGEWRRAHHSSQDNPAFIRSRLVQQSEMPLRSELVSYADARNAEPISKA
jgi:AraC family transcriptional regulator